MEKDTIITLDDNVEYALLDKIIIDGKKYFFAIKLDKETKNPTTEYEIFEEEKENNEIYMNLVEDNEFKEMLFVEFTNNYINTIEEANNN